MTDRRKCERDGCENLASVDEFCSSYCAKIHYGTAPPPRSAKERRNERDRVERLRRKHGTHVKAVNPDAMIGRAPGSPGMGKRR